MTVGHVFQQLHRSSAQANTLRCQLSSDTPKCGQYPGNVSRPPVPGGAALAALPHVAVSLRCGFRSTGHGARYRLTSVALEFIRFQPRWEKGCGGAQQDQGSTGPAPALRRRRQPGITNSWVLARGCAARGDTTVSAVKPGLRGNGGIPKAAGGEPGAGQFVSAPPVTHRRSPTGRPSANRGNGKAAGSPERGRPPGSPR